MKKLLAWGDYVAPTGFSQVMSNILKRLPEDEWDITVLAVNYDGDPDYEKERFPGKIYPAKSGMVKPGTIYDDYMGRQKFIDMVREGDFDLVFVNLDPWVIRDVMEFVEELRLKKTSKSRKKFKLITYIPIDCVPREEWFKGFFNWSFHRPVLYSQYAKEEMSKLFFEFQPPGGWMVIPHGIDMNDYFPPNSPKDYDDIAEFRKNFFQNIIHDEDFLLVNINRNTRRKDLARSLMVIKRLRELDQRYYLYLHCFPNDDLGDISKLAWHMGLKLGHDYFIPNNMTSNGYDIETMRLIYWAADGLISTTRGEGCGLSILEAMATKTPVIAPDNTAISEMLRPLGPDNSHTKGLLVKSGGDYSLWDTSMDDLSVLRPLVDVESMVGTLYPPGFRMTGFENFAFSYVNKFHDWDKIVKNQWLPLFRSVLNAN